MATKKFSEFQTVAPTALTKIVGYESNSNVQFEVSDINIEDLDGAIPINTNTTGTLDISRGGTGEITRQNAINALADVTNSTNGEILQNINNNVEFAPQKTNMIINGTFRNVFGGSPQIIGDVLEFGTAKTSATDHGSVFYAPYNCTIKASTAKWVSGTPMNLLPGNTAEVRCYALQPKDADVTNANNWSFIADLGLQFDPSQNGFPALSQTSSPVSLLADFVYMFVLIETGSSIAPTSAEIDVYLHLEMEQIY